MPTEEFKGMRRQGGSAISLWAAGSAAMVANLNTLATNKDQDACDPWALAAGEPDEVSSAALSSADEGTALNHANIRILPAGRFSYVHLYHVRDDNSNITEPKIQVFGRCPAPEKGTPDLRAFPADDDSDDFPDVSDWWMSLIDPDEANASMQFSGTIGQYGEASVAEDIFYMTKPITLYLQGARDILVGVETVGAGYTAGLVVAVFSG